VPRARITSNTLIRCLVDILFERDGFLSPPEINNEEEAKTWLKLILFK